MLCMLPLVLQAQDKFEISGKLPETLNGKLAILSYKNNLGKDKNDTVAVNAGKFKFTGETAFGNRAYLVLIPVKKDTSKVRRQTDYKDFYLEKGKY